MRLAQPGWLLLVACALTLISCARPGAMRQGGGPGVATARTNWFPRVEPDKLVTCAGVSFIAGLRGYQQTTDYTCGPAALMALARYYHPDGVAADVVTEMRIAQEAGTRSLDVLKTGGKPGTTPEEMKRWLETHGFEVTLSYEEKGDGSALKQLEANLKKGVPTIVEWAELGGHWVIAVGYDNRGNDDPWDDVLVLADSFDRYDDCNDGYSYVNANRFYWLWYDAFCFDKLTWRTMITATPVHARAP